MSTTVLTNQSVGAYEAEGKTNYTLWAETYEKNCYPHTPRWACVHVGDLQKTMEKIFGIASECEGGMIQSSKGRISPEAMIRRWLRELEVPVRQESAGTLWAKRIKGMKTEPAVREALSLYGRLEEFDRQGYVHLDPQEDATLIRGLLEKNLLVSWHLFDKPPATNAAPAPELGYIPPKSHSCTNEMPRMYQLGSGNFEPDLLVRNQIGEWENRGWAYLVVSNFVDNYWRTELSNPGHFATSIREFREACQNAPKAPSGTAFAFNLSAVTEDQKKAFRHVLEKNKSRLDAQNIVVRDTGNTVALDMSGASDNHIPLEIRDFSETVPVKWAVPDTPEPFKHVPEHLRTKELCLKAIQQDGRALQHVPSDIMQKVKSPGMGM